MGPFKIGDAWDIVAGVFLLILVYLLVSRATAVNRIIATIASSSLKGVAVLQGRSAAVAGV